jgi:hypothetical protein
MSNNNTGSAVADQQRQMAQLVKDQMDQERSIYEQLSVPFGPEALSADTSRGFALTSIKAQYVIERLNTVLGIGGWRLEGNYEVTKDADGKEMGVLFHGQLSARIGNRMHTVPTVGYSEAKRNKGDQYKGAKTDALSKAASYLGVGNEVFKGLVDPTNLQHGESRSSNGAMPKAKSSFGKTMNKKTEDSSKFDPF